MSPLLSLLAPLIAQVALADSTRAQVRVAIDGRAGRRLDDAQLHVDQPGVSPAQFRDDGGLPGDVKGDGVQLAVVEVARVERLRFSVSNGGVALGSFDVVLPASGGADFALKSTDGDPPLVLDLQAPPIPSARDSASSGGGDVGDGGADQIRVRFSVDDRAFAKLDAPQLVVDQDGVVPAPLTDDGSVSGDTAGDSVWWAEVVVGRAQYLAFTVRDGGAELGELSVFLPSSSEAEVVARTTGSGLELVTEPLSTSDVDSPTAGVSGATGGGADRLAHVVWVCVALFAVAFAWLRGVVARVYTGEVRPVLRRLDRWLAQELGEDL